MTYSTSFQILLNPCFEKKLRTLCDTNKKEIHKIYVSKILNISGNDAIHQLTKGINSYLYIGIESRLSKSIMFKLYDEFSISGEDKNYTLHIERPKFGTLGMYNSKNYGFSIFVHLLRYLLKGLSIICSFSLL